MKITDIVKGHYNEFINAQNDLAEQRLAVCKACPLYKITALGAVCNPNLYLNTDTNGVSEIPQPGFKKGCGCRLNAKTRLPESKCPLSKW